MGTKGRSSPVKGSRPDKPVALVIGASGDFGQAVALELDNLGCSVALHYNSTPETVEELRNKLQNESVAARADITSWDEVTSLYDHVSEALDHPDILVNASAIRRDQLLTLQRVEQWKEVLDINLFGTYLTCKATLPKMLKKRWGRIINIVSPSGLIASIGQTAYSASKAGVIGMTRSLATECGRRGVTVNALSPGFMETRMTANVPGRVKEVIMDKLLIPRFGDVHEIAGSMQFFLDSDYMTGQVVSVDGGISIT